jgi:hypothetical protein
LMDKFTTGIAYKQIVCICALNHFRCWTGAGTHRSQPLDQLKCHSELLRLCKWERVIYLFACWIWQFLHLNAALLLDWMDGAVKSYYTGNDFIVMSQSSNATIKHMLGDLIFCTNSHQYILFHGLHTVIGTMICANLWTGDMLQQERKLSLLLILVLEWTKRCCSQDL